MTSKKRHRERVYQVTANRDNASHRVGYVEASAPTSGDCKLCVGSLHQTASYPVDVLIAPASADDIPRVALLEKQLYGAQGYPLLFFYQALAQWPSTFVTLKQNQRVKGYCLMVPVARDTVSFMSVLIGKSAQGNGFGKALMADSMSRVKHLGYRVAELTVSPDNTAAVKLYQRFGFEVERRIPDYLGPGEDRLLMRSQLS